MKLFLPIFFLILSAAIFFVYIDPTYTKLKETMVGQGQVDQALSRSKELQDVRDQLLARYNTFSPADLDHLQKLVPDHVDNVRLISDLDAMASRYGMRVRNVTIEDDKSRAQSGEIGASDSPFESVVLSFSIAGTYDMFRQYLFDLERSLRLVDVVGLEFTANETGIYSYTVHMKTYWLKP